MQTWPHCLVERPCHERCVNPNENRNHTGKSFSWAGTHVLQAELELLLVWEEILCQLHCQVVVGEEAVEKCQHLQWREGTH